MVEALAERQPRGGHRTRVGAAGGRHRSPPRRNRLDAPARGTARAPSGRTSSADRLRRMAPALRDARPTGPQLCRARWRRDRRARRRRIRRGTAKPARLGRPLHMDPPGPPSRAPPMVGAPHRTSTGGTLQTDGADSGRGRPRSMGGGGATRRSGPRATLSRGPAQPHAQPCGVRPRADRRGGSSRSSRGRGAPPSCRHVGWLERA